MKFTRCFAVVLFVGCGSTPAPVEPPHVLWVSDAQSLDNPFPDSRLLTATGAALRPDFYRPFMMPKAVTSKLKTFFKGYADLALTDVRGFGNFGPTLLRTSVPIDPTSLKGSVSRLRKTASGYEVLEAEVAVEHSTDVLLGTGKDPSSEFPQFLFVRPGVPLLEGDEGLVVVKKGPKTTDGALLGRGFDWDKDPSRPDLTAIAAALKIPEAEVLIALPQKAVAVTDTLAKLATWVDSPAGLPKVTVPAHAMIPEGGSTRPVGVWTNADTDWATIRSGWLELTSFSNPSPSVGRVVLGELAAHDLRDNGIWRADWVADPSGSPVVPLRFVLSVPVGTRPTGGWPTVIGAHGLNGRNVPVKNVSDSYCLENAQILAAKGFACLGIDAPSHGVRGNFVDFFSIDRPTAIRDEFREMTFDLLQLARAAPSIDVDGDGQGDLSPELGFLGNSLGGIMGSSFVPVATHVHVAVLNVPGGGLLNILVSPDIRDKIGLLISARTGGSFDTLEYYSGFMIFRAVAQPFLEQADPVNIAKRLTADKAVLVQEAKGDLTIPNFATEALAGAMKLQVPSQNVSGTALLQVLSHVDPAKYLSAAELVGYNPHGAFSDIAPLRASAMKFLESGGREFQGL